jgi:hypothetical protein
MAKGSPGRLGEPFPGQGGPAGLYGLGNGSGFSIGDLTLGVRSPRQASDRINGGGISGGCRSGMELFGEHRFSVRDQVPPKGARDFRQSSAAAKNGSCNDSVFRGVSGLRDHLIFPGLAGHRPALIGGFVVFWGSFSVRARFARRKGFGSFVIRVK